MPKKNRISESKQLKLWISRSKLLETINNKLMKVKFDAPSAKYFVLSQREREKEMKKRMNNNHNQLHLLHWISTQLLSKLGGCFG